MSSPVLPLAALRIGGVYDLRGERIRRAVYAGDGTFVGLADAELPLLVEERHYEVGGPAEPVELLGETPPSLPLTRLVAGAANRALIHALHRFPDEIDVIAAARRIDYYEALRARDELLRTHPDASAGVHPGLWHDGSDHSPSGGWFVVAMDDRPETLPRAVNDVLVVALLRPEDRGVRLVAPPALDWEVPESASAVEPRR